MYAKKKILKQFWILFTAILLLSGCCVNRFPLCEKLSDTKPSPQECIGTTLFKVCKKRHITITVLSSNIAEFKGPRMQMKWLQDNYHILLCDFDQVTTILGADEYTRCISHSKEWLKIVQSKNLDNLMLDGTLYCPVCLPNKICY